MSDPPIRLAISTCPNDTFAFHGLLTGQVDRRGLEFEIELLDIQQLNEGLEANRFDVAKASFHAALRLSDRAVVLRSGAALGFGVGPLLLAAEAGSEPGTVARSDGGARRDESVEPDDTPHVTLCPGPDTTATLLFRLFYGSDRPIRHVLFSEIMPALKAKRAGFGVCIHEGRFTWESSGLCCVADLGMRWEQATGLPLPLGGILARRDLGDETIRRVQQVVRDSIEFGMAHRDQTVSTMKRYAQEFDREVLFQHVDLYVNRWTLDLGREGEYALAELARRACTIPGLENASIEVVSRT